jgi:hypothetical protein
MVNIGSAQPVPELPTSHLYSMCLDIEDLQKMIGRDWLAKEAKH